MSLIRVQRAGGGRGAAPRQPPLQPRRCSLMQTQTAASRQHPASSCILTRVCSIQPQAASQHVSICSINPTSSCISTCLQPQICISTSLQLQHPTSSCILTRVCSIRPQSCILKRVQLNHPTFNCIPDTCLAASCHLKLHLNTCLAAPFNLKLHPRHVSSCSMPAPAVVWCGVVCGPEVLMRVPVIRIRKYLLAITRAVDRTSHLIKLHNNIFMQHTRKTRQMASRYLF